MPFLIMSSRCLCSSLCWQLSQMCVQDKNDKMMTFFFFPKQTFSSDFVFLLLRLTGKKSVTFLLWEILLSVLIKKGQLCFSIFNESWNKQLKKKHTLNCFPILRLVLASVLQVEILLSAVFLAFPCVACLTWSLSCSLVPWLAVSVFCSWDPHLDFSLSMSKMSRESKVING